MRRRWRRRRSFTVCAGKICRCLFPADLEQPGRADAFACRCRKMAAIPETEITRSRRGIGMAARHRQPAWIRGLKQRSCVSGVNTASAARQSAMKSTLVNDTPKTYVLVLETGDEAVNSIEGFARDNAISAAQITAIGAFSDVVLGFFDWETKDTAKSHCRSRSRPFPSLAMSHSDPTASHRCIRMSS